MRTGRCTRRRYRRYRAGSREVREKSKIEEGWKSGGATWPNRAVEGMASNVSQSDLLHSYPRAARPGKTAPSTPDADQPALQRQRPSVFVFAHTPFEGHIHSLTQADAWTWYDAFSEGFP